YRVRSPGRVRRSPLYGVRGGAIVGPRHNHRLALRVLGCMGRLCLRVDAQRRQFGAARNARPVQVLYGPQRVVGPYYGDGRSGGCASRDNPSGGAEVGAFGAESGGTPGLGFVINAVRGAGWCSDTLDSDVERARGSNG